MKRLKEWLKGWWKIAPGSMVAVFVVFGSFIALCLYWWLGPDSLNKLWAFVGWLVLSACCVRICSLVDISQNPYR